MPELPDLQVFSRNLHRKLKGKTVEKAKISRNRKLTFSEEELNKKIQNQNLKEVRREGKELFLDFANGNVLSIHLMLNGELHIIEKGNGPQYAIIEFIFKDDSRLVLSDRRGMAKVALNPEKSAGIDALSSELDQKFLMERLSQKKTAIKNFLLDQQIIKGVGNAYADEILWDAGISPFSISNKIPENKIDDLIKSINRVLKNAEKQIRNKYPDITFGEVRDFLYIHNPKKKESPDGALIHTQKIGSRKTYYTDEQELYQ